jgi:hypothetical protein
VNIKRIFLEVNSIWYEGLGKVQGLPNMLSDLSILKYLPETQENQACNAMYSIGK